MCRRRTRVELIPAVPRRVADPEHRALTTPLIVGALGRLTARRVRPAQQGAATHIVPDPAPLPAQLQRGAHALNGTDFTPTLEAAHRTGRRRGQRFTSAGIANPGWSQRVIFDLDIPEQAVAGTGRHGE